jgi:hypothetical protein
VQGFRLCYSFSAKATLFNMLADALKRDSDLQLAGWFFVGEGAGQPYADDVARCMWDQFRLAFCKAIAANEIAVDDAMYERTFKECSRMMGIVVLRGVGPVEVDKDRKEPGLRYAVHEFAFPFTRQRMRQDIRSKLKGDGETTGSQDLTVPVSAVPTTSEVVDLVSDDDDHNDDKAILYLAAVEKSAAAPPPSATDDDDTPLLAGHRVSTPHEMSGSTQADAQPPSAPCPLDHYCDDEDGAGVGPAQQSAGNRVEGGRKENPDIAGADDRGMLDTGVAKGASLKESACGANDNSVAGASLLVLKMVSASVSAPGATTTKHLSSTASADVACSEQISTAAPEKRPMNAREHGVVASYAKLRVGKRSFASIQPTAGTVSPTAGTGSDDALSSHAATHGANAAEQQDAANMHSAAFAAEGTPELNHRLQEYDKVCDAHRSLHRKAHMRAQAAPQNRQDAQDDCNLFVHNSVLVTVMNLAVSRGGSYGLHGVLVGSRRRDKLSILQALAANGDPPSCNGGSVEQDAAWLREQAQSLFPEACLLPERKLHKHDDVRVSKDENVTQGSTEDAKGQAQVQQVERESEEVNRAEEKSDEPLKPSTMEAFTSTKGTAIIKVEQQVFRVGDGDEGNNDEQANNGEQASGQEARESVKELDTKCNALTKEGHDPEHVDNKTAPSDSARSMAIDVSEEGLVVLGYFRVAAAGAGLRALDSDIRMLSSLNAEGLGLVCSVQEGTEVVSVSDFVQIVGYGADVPRDSQLKWQVVQEPFLPRRVLQECAACAQEADGGSDGAAAALVDLYTVNLRVQEAYVKRHLCMSTGANTKEKAYRSVFLVGGPEPTVEEIHDDLVYQGVSTGGTSYSNPYKTSPGAPGLGFRV